jgi:hypothetical protein
VGVLPPNPFTVCWKRIVFGSNNKWIWDAKLPLKINFFLRMLFLLEIISRKGIGLVHPSVLFCNEHESLKHLFFGCSHTEVIWGVVGSVLNAHGCPKTLWQPGCMFSSLMGKNIIGLLAAFC